MKTVRFSLSVAALCLLAPFAAAASSSQVAMSMAAGVTTHPIQVSACQAERNVTTTYNWAGYTPGFYPGYAYGGYWGWPSVYGPSYYQPAYASESPTLGIDYMNVTHAVMKQIEFGLIVKGSLVAEVKDVGTFSPGAEIKHKFGVSSNIFPLQTSFQKCVPLKITFEDGSKWKNPHLPAYRASMYGHPVH
jgi:hypothetical protein